MRSDGQAFDVEGVGKVERHQQECNDRVSTISHITKLGLIFTSAQFIAALAALDSQDVISKRVAWMLMERKQVEAGLMPEPKRYRLSIMFHAI